MLRNGNRRTYRSCPTLLLLFTMALAPGAIAPAAEAPNSLFGPAAPAANKPAIERRVVNRALKDFPKKVDLSTPESAAVAWSRAVIRKDLQAFGDVTWWTIGPPERNLLESNWNNSAEAPRFLQALAECDIGEVLTYRGDLALVVQQLKFAKGTDSGMNISRVNTNLMGRIQGNWKFLNTRFYPSGEAARPVFEESAQIEWQRFTQLRAQVQQGLPVSLVQFLSQGRAGGVPAPQGLSAERAELIGRVEEYLARNPGDAVARRSLGWGEVQNDNLGTRSIRYLYEAWSENRTTKIMNQTFSFNAQGRCVAVQDVEGFPQQKSNEPADVTTPAGLEKLVETFLQENFRDITRRETLEWSPPTKAPNGDISIRYKYRARIWDHETKIMNQIFTFNAQGESVSVTNVEGFPQAVAEEKQ